MKILILTFFEPIPDLDKGTRHLRFGILANRLVGSGHEVNFITSNFDHYSKKFRNDFTKSKVHEFQGVNYHLINSFGYASNISISRILNNFLLIKNLIKYLKKNKFEPDVVICALPRVGFCKAAIDYFPKSIIIIDIIDKWPEIYLSIIPLFRSKFLNW